MCAVQLGDLRDELRLPDGAATRLLSDRRDENVVLGREGGLRAPGLRT
jgi:hypothetical protein